jgi:hypothetical protein
VYYITFVDNKGGGHLYVADFLGALLRYSEIPLAESYTILLSFIEEGGILLKVERRRTKAGAYATY